MTRKKKDTSEATAARWTRMKERQCDDEPDAEVCNQSQVGEMMQTDDPRIHLRSTRHVEEIAAGLYLVHNPSVIVCEKCQIIVKNPVAHFENNNHKVRNEEVLCLVKNKIAGIQQDSDWMIHASSVVEALPFIPVFDGWKCNACHKCTKHAHNLDCCEVWSTKDVQKVKIRRFGEGASKRRYTYGIGDIS